LDPRIRIRIQPTKFNEDPDPQQLNIARLCNKSSVADPGCLSRILIFTHPGSRIPDPKTATKERGEKKLDVKPFYVATKFNKIVNYFSFDVLKKKMWANFQRIIELLTKKIVKKLFKIWSWDPGSESSLYFPFIILPLTMFL
jgi:hypothetical protein